MKFRMPLDGENVGGPRIADRLDDVVRLGPGLDDEVAAKILHRLVMNRVGLHDARARIEARQAAVRNQRRRVAILLVDFPVAMIERVRSLGREILVERATEADVYDLRAATDPEDGLFIAMNERSSEIS